MPCLAIWTGQLSILPVESISRPRSLLRGPLHQQQGSGTQPVSSQRARDQDTGVLSPGSVTDALCNLEQIVSLRVHSFDHLYKRGGLADEVLWTQGACVLREGACEPSKARTKAQTSHKRLECFCSVLKAPSARALRAWTAPPAPPQAPCGGGLESSAGSPGPDNRRCQCSS